MLLAVTFVVVASMLLEKAARAELTAVSLGDGVSVTSDEEALAKREHIYHEENINRAWQYLVRKENNWDRIIR